MTGCHANQKQKLLKIRNIFTYIFVYLKKKTCWFGWAVVRGEKFKWFPHKLLRQKLHETKEILIFMYMVAIRLRTTLIEHSTPIFHFEKEYLLFL